MYRKNTLGNSPASRASARRRMTLFAVVAIAAATIALKGVTATPATINGIILLVGADASQRVVNWYASADTHQVVQVAPTDDLEDGAFPSHATNYTAVVAANTVKVHLRRIFQKLGVATRAEAEAIAVRRGLVR